MEYLFSHGIKLSSILSKTFELLGLDRLKSVVLIYKKYIFPIFKQNKILHLFSSEFAKNMYLNPIAKRSLKLSKCNMYGELLLCNSFYAEFLDKTHTN